MPRGRKPERTPEMPQASCATVRSGLSLSSATARVGIGITTVNEGLRRGEGRDRQRQRSGVDAASAAAIKTSQAEDQAQRAARIEYAARGGKVLDDKTSTRTTIHVKGEQEMTTAREVRYTPPAWPPPPGT